MVNRYLFTVAIATASAARAQPFSDVLVQSPQLAKPQRGSLAGPVSREAFSPGELGSGVFTMPLPIAIPSERGSLPANPFPSYSAEYGISEWGLGWRADLRIRRFRLVGHLDYRTDDRVGPWGRMIKGSDGAWYPIGLQTAVRVVETGDALVAMLPDGSKWTFGASTRETTQDGTYAWVLDTIETVDKQRAAFAYTVREGRAWLDKIEYGGSTELQYRVVIAYEPVAHPYVTFASGERASIDRRVQRIDVLARDTQTKQFAARWRYLLAYEQDAWGTAFYLTSVQRELASGDREPAISFAYKKPVETVNRATFQQVAQLGSVVAPQSIEVIQPHKSSQFDLGDDGLLDLEVAADATTIRRLPTGFVRVPAPPLPANVDRRCRPADNTANTPRLLVNTSSTSEPKVVSLLVAPNGTSTELRVCRRDGARLVARTLDGVWQPSALTRVVDLTGDTTPDLVQLDPGRVTTRLSTPTAHAFEIGPAVVQSLTPNIPIEAVWVQDWNGDAIPDVIARSRSELVIWFGRGRGRFEERGRIQAFQTPAGPIPDLRPYQITFVDVNHDGATDAILTQNVTASLFVNDGTALTERKVPAFASFDWHTGAPMVADLAGRGEVELAGLRGTDAFAVDLTEPGSGLLARVDDGRGVVREMTYGRADATPGLRGRPVVLSRVKISVAGEAIEELEYSYADPKHDPRTGTLLGFARVTRTNSHARQEVTLLQTPSATGLVLETTTADSRDPRIVMVTSSRFEEVKLWNVPFVRKRDNRSLWRAVGSHASAPGEVVEYTRYSGVCPVETRRVAGTSVLLTTTVAAAPSLLQGHLHCIDKRRTMRGTHDNAALDFEYTLAIDRDDAGRAIKLALIDGTASLTLQQLAYDDVGLLQTLDATDRGRTTLSWDRESRQLAASTTPEGKTIRATKRDPRTSALVEARTELGDQSLTEGFAYDGFERLAKRWDDHGGSTAQRPDASFEYVFSSDGKPGRIRTRTLLDANSVREDIDLTSAAGATIATATRTPSAWAIGTTRRVRAEGVGEAGFAKQLPAATKPADLDYGALELATITQRSATTAFGVVEQSTLQHADSRRVETRHHAISGGRVREIVEVAGAVHHTSILGADGRESERIEADGTRSSYVWDRLGRLRSIDLPNGRRATITFDRFGRQDRIIWRNWITLRASYAPASMLPQKRIIESASGAVLQQVAFAYDNHGRVVERTHTEPGAASRTFRYAYDRAPPECGWTAVEAGATLMEAGPGYRTCFRHDAAGLLVARTDAIDGWLTLTTELSYFDDGSVKSERRRLGSVATLSIDRVADATGRITQLKIGGGQTIELAYDARNRLLKASSAAASSWIERDPSSELDIGVGGTLAAHTWRHSTHLSSTGDPDRDRIEIDHGVKTARHTVTPRGFLASSTGIVDEAYTYDAAGQLVSITAAGATTPVVQPPNDALGRIRNVAGATITYAADSQAAEIRRGQDTWTFVTDAAGYQRVRRHNGTVERADFADVIIIGTRLYWPFTLGGRLLGFVVDGRFVPAALDAHRTAIATPSGPRSTTSYGAGARVADPVDYHGGAAQPGIDGLRFGTRDYVPALGAFLTPDATFVENPAGCVGNVVECNLYGFANSNPTRFTDPSGASWLEEYLVNHVSTDTWFRATRAAVFAADHMAPGLVEAQWFKDLSGWDASTQETVEAMRRQEGYKANHDRMELALDVAFFVGGMRDKRGPPTRSKTGGASSPNKGSEGEKRMRETYEEEWQGRERFEGESGQNRISDDSSPGALWEAKNTKSQGFTSQIKDYLARTRSTNRQFNLVVHPNTKLSAPLLEEWVNAKPGEFGIGEFNLKPPTLGPKQ